MNDLTSLLSISITVLTRFRSMNGTLASKPHALVHRSTRCNSEVSMLKSRRLSSLVNLLQSSLILVLNSSNKRYPNGSAYYAQCMESEVVKRSTKPDNLIIHLPANDSSAPSPQSTTLNFFDEMCLDKR